MPPMDDDDVEFGDVAEMQVQGIHAARWDRVKKDVDVREVIFMLHSKRGSPISCPFHGRDSKPSFYYFPENNDYTCYGCAEGDNYWDTIKIVTRTLEITRPQAVRWLEREFHLPRLDPSQDDGYVDLDAEEAKEAEEETPPLLTVAELQAPYQAQIFRMRCRSKGAGIENLMEDVPEMFTLIKRYFDADHFQDPYMLAHVVGASAVRLLVRNKAHA